MSEEIECLFKNLVGILSFTYRSNPPPNLFQSYLKILKPVILNCEFGKVESNFDSAIRKISKSLIVSAIISNLFLMEFIFRCPMIKFL